jgi:hypothetical protein
MINSVQNFIHDFDHVYLCQNPLKLNFLIHRVVTLIDLC